MLWAVSGGAGFLGLHLARRLLADGHEVRTLDVVPLDDSELERSVQELRGDIKLAQGDKVAARAAYQKAMQLDPPAAARDFLQRKLDDLPGETAQTPAGKPAEKPADKPAEKS